MTTLTIDVADLATVKASMKAAFRGVPQDCTYSFASEEQLLTTLNANRWAILKALTGAGPLGVRALARRARCEGRAHGCPGTGQLRVDRQDQRGQVKPAA